MVISLKGHAALPERTKLTAGRLRRLRQLYDEREEYITALHNACYGRAAREVYASMATGEQHADASVQRRLADLAKRYIKEEVAGLPAIGLHSL